MEITCAQVESESDADPDIIPLQGCPRSSPTLPCAAPSPAATLLPPERYKYSPVPAHVRCEPPHPPHPHHPSGLPRAATLPRIVNPHHRPYPGTEGDVPPPPPPPEFQSSSDKSPRAPSSSSCFSRHSSQSTCELDAPSTPLLGKRESSV
ncbi:WAS/WASL-interacting protein family member 3-like [Penaeus monodon]|uniref:WAS/WASL-interacting protein family member 3-like n=1 Tax=Penaeus monodon TaxID=6687 RepID=UPI0018A6FC39|nr:WAS/WASL-interacting protein family member 3-like [Penaeus monodon]